MCRALSCHLTDRLSSVPSRSGGSERSLPMVDQYIPGTCNIGPAEIARRMRIGHIGLAVTVLLGVVLLALGAAAPWRLLLALPATAAAAGYLQARSRFCFDYGFRGVYNFDALGHHQRVAAEEALA